MPAGLLEILASGRDSKGRLFKMSPSRVKGVKCFISAAAASPSAPWPMSAIRACLAALRQAIITLETGGLAQRPV